MELRWDKIEKYSQRKNMKQLGLTAVHVTKSFSENKIISGIVTAGYMASCESFFKRGLVAIT